MPSSAGSFRRLASGLPSILLLLVLPAASPLAAIQPHEAPADLADAVRPLRFPTRRADPAAARALEQVPDWAAFRLLGGQGWSVRADDLSPGAVSILGGAMPVIPGDANHLTWAAIGPRGAVLEGTDLRDFLAERSRGLVGSLATLFPVPAAELVPPPRGALARADHGRLTSLVMHQVHEGVPVLGARLLLFLNGGNLTYLEALDLAPVTEPSAPAVSPEGALDALRRYLGGSLHGLAPGAPADLLYLPVRADDGRLAHRLVWSRTFGRPGDRGTWRAVVDAGTGEVVAFEDVNRYACTLEPEDPAGKVTGGVRPEQATDAERVWGLPGALVLNGRSEVADRNGQFRWIRTAPATCTLDGRYAQTLCSGCQEPSASATAGVIEFGTGGMDEVSNGTSTPAERTAYFHVNHVREMAAKWLDLDWFDDNVPTVVNIQDECNAYWDGLSLNFFRSSDKCTNTGEIRDVVSHEWGHSLDQYDGADVRDGARGEAVADILATLVDHDSCLGESFYKSGGPSDNCTGVRDVDENAPGGLPLLTLSNVKDLIPDCNRCARGPLGEEVHLEGELYGEANWHLIQDLLNGVDAENPPLGPEAAWLAMERMYFGSASVVTTYVPWIHPDSPADPPSGIPTGPGDFPGGASTYLGYLLADDEGDGLANGTPHAAYVNDAFGHHELTDDMDPGTPEVDLVPDAPNCVQPADPDFTLGGMSDPTDGTPQVVATWTDVPGAASYTLYRARATGDGMIPIAEGIAPGVQTAVDDGVDIGEEFYYWVAAFGPDGCPSPGDTKRPIIPARPRFIAQAPTVVDGALGDGDGEADIGETFDLSVPLANEGNATALGVSATLISYDVRVKLEAAGPVNYPVLASGGGAGAPFQNFRVRLAPDPSLCGTTVELALDVETNIACGLALPVSLPVAADCTPADTTFLRYASTIVQDGGDGQLDPGEAPALQITITNLGSQAATNVTGTLVSLTPGVTVLNGALRFNDVIGGGSQPTHNPQPQVSVSPAFPCGSPARFRLDLASDQGPYTDEFTLPVGDTRAVLEDDFELDRGWTAAASDPYTGGQWSRAAPAGTFWQPEGGNPFGTPATAYVTGASADTYWDEVLDATLTLTSPFFDLSGYDAGDVSYFRWFADTLEHDDVLEVELSSDEFRNDIAVLEQTGNDPLWRRVTFPVPPAMLKPGVQLRFTVSDPGDNSIVEAAVDDVLVQGHRCTDTAVGLPAIRFQGFTVQDPAPFGNGDGFADPGESVTLLLDVANVGGGPAQNVAATVSSPSPGVSTLANPTTAFTPDPLAPGGTASSVPDHVGATLDAAQLACGSSVDLVFDLAWQGGTYTTPPQPLEIGQRVPVFTDDFEADRGWTTSAAVNDPVRGAWQRVDPQATYLQGYPIAPENDDPFGTGTMAYVTGDGVPNQFSEYTVWNNEVRLDSPPMDLSDYNSAHVDFFADHVEFRFTGAPRPLFVEGSNDGFATSILLGTVENGNGWRHFRFPIPTALLTDNFQVRFRVSNQPPAAIVDSAVDDVAIIGDWCPGAPLKALFWSSAPTCEGDTVHFVSVPEGPVTEIAWDIDGDGQYGVLSEEMQKDPSYTWATEGVRQVGLRVRDGSGGEDTIVQQVEILDRPVASIDTAPSVGQVAEVLDFAGSATGGDGQYLFTWDFGDGNQATGAAVQHTYASVGTFNVVLNVTDADGAGCPDTATAQIGIEPNRPPDAIQGLMLRRNADTSITFDWQPDPLAATYNLYGGDLMAVASLDPGCVDSDLTATTTTLGSTASGRRYYLVTGKNVRGEGVLDAPDATRGVPLSPCP